METAGLGRMSQPIWTEEDTQRALEIWNEYQERHDLSSRRGQAAGIDPRTGTVWFGESAQDIEQQMRAAGAVVPFYCVRVGLEYYLRKGACR